jgi:hypothetical protein
MRRLQIASRGKMPISWSNAAQNRDFVTRWPSRCGGRALGPSRLESVRFEATADLPPGDPDPAHHLSGHGGGRVRLRTPAIVAPRAPRQICEWCRWFADICVSLLVAKMRVVLVPTGEECR